MGGIYTSIIYVNPENFYGSYSTGATPNQHNKFIKIEKWMKGNALNKWESTLNLCVHAHGYDVELIMKLLVTIIIPLV